MLLFFFALIACEATVSTNVVFVQTKDARFVINGSPFLFNGFNAYWMMNLASDPTQRAKVSEVFKEASAAGLTVCRTWAFADGGYRALQISPGVYDEGVFQVAPIFSLIFFKSIQSLPQKLCFATIKKCCQKLLATFRYICVKESDLKGSFKESCLKVTFQLFFLIV